jgi:transposase
MIDKDTIVEQLLQENRQLRATLALLNSQVEELRKQIATLQKNSRNSSKPPSSDIVKPPKPGPKVGRRKQGAQAGHPKHERALFPNEQIDTFHDHVLPSCPDCHGEVILCAGLEPRRLQQIDLKEGPVLREEHRSHAVWCPRCQKIHYMAFPEEVVNAGFFMERMTALVAYLKYVCHASFSTIRRFMRDVLGEPVSRGYLRKVLAKVTGSLDGPYEELLNRIPLEAVVNVDESGHKDKGQTFWTWVFRTNLYALFHIDKTRSTQVLIDVLGQEFNGVLGCDYFSSYRSYLQRFDATIQFCIAHLIRDIRFLTTLPDPQSQAYGHRLLDVVRELFKVIHRRGTFSARSFREALESAKQQILHTATTDVPSCLDKAGKELKRHAQNMAERFRKQGEAYFTFITTPGVDPTNNMAEQAIRFIVIDRHVTQGTRSLEGRTTCERLWTVIATCQLQGRSAFEFILKAVHAYYRGQPSPSLLPVST